MVGMVDNKVHMECSNLEVVSNMAHTMLVRKVSNKVRELVDSMDRTFLNEFMMSFKVLIEGNNDLLFN